jgi:hypothetical protein
MDITVKNSTIAAGVMCVLGKKKESSQHGPDGKQPAIRKNPHVIDAGFELDITHS